MATLTVENYVKCIYQIQACTNLPATTGEIAKRLEVSPASVTSMLRTLSESNLVMYQSHRGVRLSDAGTALALHVLRRHRLVELFLVKTLDMTWDEVHEEAENLEHAVSDALVDRMEKFLGYPERDPHGDPIPKQDGTLIPSSAKPLSDCAPTTKFVLERVMDQSSDFLRFLSESSLNIGAKGSVLENLPQAGALRVSVSGQTLSLSHAAASKLYVQSVDR